MERAIHFALAIVASLIALAFAGLLLWTAFKVTLEASHYFANPRFDRLGSAGPSDQENMLFHSALLVSEGQKDHA